MFKPNTTKAIDELGGIRGATSRLDVTRATLWNWRKEGAPETRCYQLAALTSVPVDDLLSERNKVAA